MRGALIGMTLGDGYIDARHGPSATFRVEHAIAQRKYAEFKLARLKALVGGRGELRQRDRPDKRTGRTYQMVGFVVGDNVFRTIHGYVYHEGVKTYSRRMLDMLTPEGIAYWYLDDGYAKQVFQRGKLSSVYTMLYTYCSEGEVQTIIEYFVEVWNIRPGKIRMYGDKWVVKFNTSESKKFIALILDYVPECMRYKTAHVQSQLLHECSRARVQCENCGVPLVRLSRLRLCVKCHDRARSMRLRYSPNCGETKPVEALDKEPSR
jgi:hypothetical protein